MNDSQFNVYHTDKTRMTSAFGYDCLYYYENEVVDHPSNKISFCLRPETAQQSNGREQSCNGKLIAFEHLKTNHVNASDLLYWNAAIETIELYEKYLASADVVDDDDEYYCNCSVLTRFGKSCQYDIGISNERSFVSTIRLNRPAVYGNGLSDYFTCYVGIRCETNLFCLDWRQICNGIVDCDHGEDEPFELCSQMESNECDAEKEFRCQNGMCIPISLTPSSCELCLDRSDNSKLPRTFTSHYWTTRCLQYPSTACDATNIGWRRFACNNGQSMYYSDLMSKVPLTGFSCANNLHLMYLKRMFSDAEKNECWQAMICLSGFDYLYPHISCFQENIVQNIEKHCPNEYYFPSNSVVYSFVFFLYDKMKHVNWITSTGPDYICYKNEYCQMNIWNYSTVSKNNLKCILVDQAMFSWKNFYEYVAHLFNSCFKTSSSAAATSRMFYRCDRSNTSISIHRVKNKKRDCYFNDDEDPNINLCSMKTNDQFHCLANPNECVRQSFIGDHAYDCLDRSDEYFYSSEDAVHDSNYDFRPWAKRNLAEIYRLTELCDNFVNGHLFSLNSSETDETDCEYWPYPCDSSSSEYKDICNCANGRDEFRCSERSFNMIMQATLHCKSDEHYCIQLMNNHVNAICINMNRVDDRMIDCIGGVDEPLLGICLEQHPYDFGRRFLCMNSTVCLRLDEVCDRTVHCPFADDELICPWLLQSNSSTFSCSSALPHSVVRCDLSSKNDPYCPMGEHLWFCDLEIQGEKIAYRLGFIYEPYPPLDLSVKFISMNKLNSNKEIMLGRETFSLSDSKTDFSLCNLGYFIRSSKADNRSYCFCPPSYYGDYCQYQSEHLIVSLQISLAYPMDGSTVFRLILYLLNEDQTIISHEETVYNLKQIDLDAIYIDYLIYERMTNLSLNERPKARSLRIDSYVIKETSVRYISSWLFRISFPFLPVNQLVAELPLRNELFRIINCKKRCGSHGRCMYYVNMRYVEYCWCEPGWSGDRCQMKSSSNLCNEKSCASHSQCVILNEEKKQMKCVCPLGRSGDECYIRSNLCVNSPCRNNGTCLPVSEREFQFNCVCQDDYTGTYCESARPFSYIEIDRNITNLTVVPAIIVILGSHRHNRLFQSYRMLYTNVSLPMTVKIFDIEQFGFVQMFYNFSRNSYYAVLIQPFRTSYHNTSVLTRNRCKNISELFNGTILDEYSYLKRLKLYHLPCRHDHDLRCFFDEYRMCFCTRNHNSDCHFFNHEHGNCDYCQNGGLCLRQDFKKKRWIYTCLCQPCSDGSFCQFSSTNYFITLDMLIGTEMKTGSNSFNQQSTIVHLTLIFLLLILVFSLIFNTLSIFVFFNSKLRQVGCGLYILNLTIVSEISLILLFLRFIHTLMVQMRPLEDLLFVQIGCISLEYLVRLIPSLFDWLTVCISVERAYTVIKDVHFTKIVAMKTLKLSRWMILIVVLFNILTTLHRPFYLKLVDEPSFDDESQGHPWCVLDFGQTSWNVYEKVINVCHLIIPLIANMASVIAFISHRTKLELTSATRKDKANKYVIIKEQLLKYKPLIISPGIIIILETPRLVLTFGLACIEKTWQRYLYLIIYFISYLPLTGIVFIYIMPSPKYNAEFKTRIKQILRLLSFKKTAEQ